MYQPIEVTSARTVWIDSPSEERLGFHGSSRVQIDRDPTGLTDWKEPGDPYRATLMSGMWPDDDELRLLVVGVVPGSEQADAYLRQLVPADIQMAAVVQDDIGVTDAALAEGFKVKGTATLHGMVDIMPAWSGQTQRSIFVRLGTPRGTPQTVVTESQKEPDRKLTFDMWRIQVDSMLIARGQKPTDQWVSKEVGKLIPLHGRGVTPTEFIDRYLLHPTTEEPDGRDAEANQGSPA